MLSDPEGRVSLLTLLLLLSPCPHRAVISGEKSASLGCCYHLTRGSGRHCRAPVQAAELPPPSRTASAHSVEHMVWATKSLPGSPPRCASPSPGTFRGLWPLGMSLPVVVLFSKVFIFKKSWLAIFNILSLSPRNESIFLACCPLGPSASLHHSQPRVHLPKVRRARALPAPSVRSSPRRKTCPCRVQLQGRGLGCLAPGASVS